MKRKEIEVLPADEPKQLKLGWVVHEVIGMAVVNPRGIHAANIVPKHIFGNEEGSIDIRRWSIEIFGSHETAAKAMAEDILRRAPATDIPNDYYTIDYMEVIQAVRRNKEYILYLTGNGLGLIDPEVWAPFKKSVEKMCNTLKAFL